MHSNTLNHDTVAAPYENEGYRKTSVKNEEYYKTRFSYLGIMAVVLLLGYVIGFMWVATNELPGAVVPAYLVVGILVALFVARKAKRLNADYQKCFDYGKATY